MQRAGHGGRDCPFAGQDFIDLGSASDHGYEVTGTQTLLIHAKLNGANGTGVANGVMFILIPFNESDEPFELGFL